MVWSDQDQEGDLPRALVQGAEVGTAESLAYRKSLWPHGNRQIYKCQRYRITLRRFDRTGGIMGGEQEVSSSLEVGRYRRTPLSLLGHNEHYRQLLQGPFPLLPSDQ
jgi:hypothetical protein